jgi:DNA-binding transcriptional MerR regulator
MVSPIRPSPTAVPTAEWTMEELLARVRGAIPRVVGVDQPRYKVTDVPDARTVRYYISLGLVDQPCGRRGTFALYGYRHLLQILCVKKLQADYLPIRKIQELLRDLANDALLHMVEPGDTLEDLCEAATETPPAAGTSSETALQHDTAQSIVPADRQDGDRWCRYQLASGVELHISDGTKLHGDDLEQLTELFVRILRDRADD